MNNLLSAIHQAVRKLYQRPIGKARNACFSSGLAPRTFNVFKTVDISWQNNNNDPFY